VITLGSKVKDSITGFAGTVTCRSEYLNGCVSIGVQSPALHDGKTLGLEWIDESQLVVVMAGGASERAVVGGPQDRPPGLAHPR